jgi:polyisoprenoid-binding protein YceI
VSGKLTLHGVERPIVFPARIVVTPEAVTFDATMTVRQSEFGMSEGAKKTKDDVPVSISIRGSRKG